MPKLRVHSFSVSLDGYAAGPDQSRTRPLGVGGEKFARVGVRYPHLPPAVRYGGWRGRPRRIASPPPATSGLAPPPWGGVATVQEYLRAGLIDEMHLAIAPVLLDQGERLFDHLDGGSVGLECVELVRSTAAVHVRLARG